MSQVTSKTFTYNSIVTLGDTNCMGNMYFLNYFKLQGIVRELWIVQCVENGLSDLKSGLVLITQDANNHFIREFNLYDPILVQMQFSKLGHSHLKTRFRFYHANNQILHAEGFQTIVFANTQKKIVRIPANWKQAISIYLTDSSA